MPILLRALALLAILGATLFPDPGAPKRAWRLCILCGDAAAADLITNIMLFVPLGAALALGPRRIPLGWTVMGGALLSLAIEFAQLTLPGRDPSIRDLLANTLGTGAGWLTTHHGWRLLSPAGAAPVLSLAAALLAAAVWWTTGWLLQPSLPSAAYYGQWTPELDDLKWYKGRVLGAWLGPRPLPSERLVWSAEARELLLRGARLRVRAIAGPPERGLASLVSIYDEHDREIFLVGPDRTDLVLRYRTRADALGLDRPDLRVRGAFAGVRPGDRLVLNVERSSPGYCVALNRHRRCGVAFTLSRGWALLLYPESFPAWLMALLDAAWMGGLLVPAGLWWRARPGLGAGVGAVLTIGTILAGVLGTPALTGLHATPLGGLAAAAGFAAGAAAGAWARGRRPVPEPSPGAGVA